MQISFSKSLITICCLLLLFCNTAQAELKAKKQLKQLINKINVLQSHLLQTQKQQGAVQQQLKQAEVSIGNLAVATKQTSKQQDRQREILRVLALKQSSYQQQLATQQQHVFDELRAAYLIGHDGYLKMFFNCENPELFDRLAVYYHSLLLARSKLIADLELTLHKLQQNDREMQKQKRILDVLHVHQDNQRKQLEGVQKDRSVALGTIKTNLKDQSAQLQKLLADKQALEELLARITAAAKRHAPVVSGSISALRGKLLSPTSGKMENAFGAALGGSEARLNGILIAAAEGQEVHAIAAGRVVFADWLQGYGLLLIVDHGHGYMSLYGRNHNLYKKTGESVASGELVATVGNSGGYEKTGLYFAMRYNGRPVDPTVWLRRS